MQAGGQRFDPVQLHHISFTVTGWVSMLCVSRPGASIRRQKVEWFIKFSRSTGFQALGLKRFYTEAFWIFDNEIDWVKRY